jgi:hypothetical protein
MSQNKSRLEEKEQAVRGIGGTLAQKCEAEHRGVREAPPVRTYTKDLQSSARGGTAVGGMMIVDGGVVVMIIDRSGTVRTGMGSYMDTGDQPSTSAT